MMRNWEVTYTIYADSSMRTSLTNAFGLKMHVQADSYSQATMIVESMFPYCCAENARPV